MIAAIGRAGGLAEEEAELAAEAVLGELAAALNWCSAQNVADHLPGPADGVVRRRCFDASMAQFAPPRFLDYVLERERLLDPGLCASLAVDAPRGGRHVSAVLTLLERAMPAAIWAEAQADLREIRRAFPPAAGREADSRGAREEVAVLPRAA